MQQSTAPGWDALTGLTFAAHAIDRRHRPGPPIPQQLDDQGHR